MWIAGILLLIQQIQLQNNFTVKLHGETIAVVNRTYFTPLESMPMVDNIKLEKFTDQLEQQIYKAPVNAKVGPSGHIIPEKTGIMLNRKAFTELFYKYFYSNSPASVEVPSIITYPKVDSELLSNIGIQLLGHYVTFYNSGNKERSHNISLAAEAINSQVVFPGETFSFNKAVGRRTAAKGYLPAPIIVRGELSEGIGGGICQVSSTLFNAVDRSGLQIIERYSHSKRVPYVPPGRDATVSWYGPDFTFKNKYNQPVLIRAKAGHGQMAVFLYSAEGVNFEPRKVPSTR
ncbi:VanW family protein [Bacillus sp. T33-2]|uniref:VanW family protein n=1 Tax=Bacillus sp. T33-2 TaxID=2054168 RepID=UPI0035B54A6E